METVHPLYQLRQSIRHTGRQYRHDTDNSWSLFHPSQGFVSAYDIAQVESALDNFERNLPSPGKLLSMAERVEASEDSSPEAKLLAELVKGFVKALSPPALYEQTSTVTIIDWD